MGFCRRRRSRSCKEGIFFIALPFKKDRSKKRLGGKGLLASLLTDAQTVKQTKTEEEALISFPALLELVLVGRIATQYSDILPAQSLDLERNFVQKSKTSEAAVMGAEYQKLCIANELLFFPHPDMGTHVFIISFF